jgi:acylpyruvate hydrolase
MRLATMRREERTRTTVDDDGRHHFLPALSVDALPATASWWETARRALDDAPAAENFALAPLSLDPRRVICCGPSFADHITDMGRSLPEFPTLLSKYADIQGLGRLDNTVRFVAADEPISEPAGMIHGRTPTGGAR